MLLPFYATDKILHLHLAKLPRTEKEIARRNFVPKCFPDLCEPERKLWVKDRKSTRLNSSHSSISYAVFCLKKRLDFEGSDLLTLGQSIQRTENNCPLIR